MRIAAIYDIHANLPALEAVIGKIRHEQVDGIVVGGDVLPGPMPLETLERFQDLDCPRPAYLWQWRGRGARAIGGQGPGRGARTLSPHDPLDGRAARSGTTAISRGVAQNALSQLAWTGRSALLPRDTSKRE